MAATQTVHQLLNSRNSNKLSPTNQITEIPESVVSRHGVVTLLGYGIKVHVDRGHLVLEDGIGPQRRQARFPRVGHGLRRLVVIGSDGMVSLSALRWLADQDAAFVMLDREGSVLLTTGPVRPSDARLRRAQALAYESGMALRIARELIARKLAGQEHIVREKLRDANAVQAIADVRLTLAEVESLEALADAERQGALAYWLVRVAYPSCHVPSERPSSRTKALADVRNAQVATDRLATSCRQSSECDPELLVRGPRIGSPTSPCGTWT